MHNLHPGANLHPGFFFWPCERCFKNLHPGANLLLLSRLSKYICTRVHIVHMNAKCVSIGDFDILQAFSVNDFVLNDIKINFKLFLSK